MAIKYYPNRVYRAKAPAIDRVMAKRQPLSTSGTQNIAGVALDVVVSNNDAWQVDSIGWTFSNATTRNFSAAIMNGRQIFQNLNDYLWFSSNITAPQRIILTPGFYTGTELATELQTRLNAATLLDGSTNAFNTAGLTFTVAYDAVTGLYDIGVTGATIQYMDVNTHQTLPLRDSIAGHLFGLNTTSNVASNVSSDTTVYGLDSETAIVSQSTNSDLTYLHNDIHIMTVDQALHLASNAGANVALTYVVDYEAIV